MKKSVLVVLMAALLPQLSYGNTETPLLPEVKKALEVPPLDEKEMAQNSYVYLLTIDAKNDDYFDISKKYLIANNNWLKGVVKDYNKDNLPSPPDLTYTSVIPDIMTVDDKSYVFYCNALERSLITPSCLANIVANKQRAIALINRSQKILTRYEQVISLPIYRPYNYPNYSKYHAFPFRLELFRAVYAIDEGEINQGLDILQREIDFLKKGFVSTDTLSRKLMEYKLITEYRIISELLNAYPNLVKEPNLAKVRVLLSSLPDYNLGLKGAVLSDRFNYLIMTITANESYYKQANTHHLTYNQNKTLNKVYLENEPYISFSQLTLPEMRNIYLTNAPIGHFKKCELDQDENTVIGDCDKDNQSGSIDAGDWDNFARGRLYSLYDVYNYLALVNLQLEILAKGLKADQVPAFLASAGDKAVNIITQKPFVWDKEKSTINTNYLTSGDSSRNPMAVRIKFNQ